MSKVCNALEEAELCDTQLKGESDSVKMVQNTVEQGVGTAAGVVGILLGIFGLGNSICGFIWVGYGGGGGHGIWSGFGVSTTMAFEFSLYRRLFFEISIAHIVSRRQIFVMRIRSELDFLVLMWFSICSP